MNNITQTTPSSYHKKQHIPYTKTIPNPLHQSEVKYNAGDVVWCNFPMIPREAFNDDRKKRAYCADPQPGCFHHPVFVQGRYKDPKTNKTMLLVVYGTSQERTPRPKHLITIEGKIAKKLGFRCTQHFDAAVVALLPETKEWFPNIEKNGRVVERLNEGYRSLMNKEIKRAIALDRQTFYKKAPKSNSREDIQ